MAISRKNQKQLKKLRAEATELWAQQQAVLGRAGQVLAHAGTNAKTITQTELLPAAKTRYDASVRPYVEQGQDAARRAVAKANARFGGRVVPAVAAATASVAQVVDQVRRGQGLASLQTGDKKARKKIQQRAAEIERQATAAIERYTAKVTKKRGVGAGGVFALVLGAVAVSGIVYALWQTFRADDDLWIADDEATAPESN